MKRTPRADGQAQHRDDGEKAGSRHWGRAEAAKYKLCSYPLAWALVEDPTTGVPRVASRDELLSLGLTGPGFEAEFRNIFGPG